MNREYAGEGIRTLELLRDWTLNPAPLTWLGNPRAYRYRRRENYNCPPAAARTAPAELSRAVHGIHAPRQIADSSPDVMHGKLYRT